MVHQDTRPQGHRVPRGDGVIGLIPVDSVYTPVRKVNYFVENTRVGDATDYDKLTTVLIPSLYSLAMMPLMLRTISVTSSFTPGMTENSC